MMYKRIFIVFFLVLFIGTTLTGILSMTVSKNIYTSSIESQLRDNAKFVEEYVLKNNVDIHSINKEPIEVISKITNHRITIINVLGDVLYDSQEDIATMDNHKDRVEVKKAIKGEETTHIRYSDTLKTDMMYFAIPWFFQNEIIGIIRLSIPLYELNGIYGALIRNIIIASILGMLLSSIIAYRYIYFITKPIKDLTAQVKEFTKGDFKKIIRISRKDEIGELAESFNEMSNQLKDTIEELKIQNIKFETVLDSMKDGIIAVDLNKSVMLINPSARRLFDIQEHTEPIGKSILALIRNTKLYDELDIILSNNTQSSIEIQIDYPKKKILKIYSKPIRYLSKYERIKGIVIVIQDLTELRNLENIRKDFVANVSHELKTPITSIKGFVETLRDGVEDEDSKDRFLEIIDLESERMIRLVEDILTLSNLERNIQPSKYEIIRVEESIIEIIQMVQPLADKKNIRINTKIGRSLTPLYYARDDFKQMLINIIDNAIKYTPNGGIVNIEAIEKEKNIEIEIKDNGIGIPKEDLPRLFERFYRVDKARSRSAGGTGLGLAIVKHILHAMNGKITVESELNKGTKFKIIIPTERSK